MKLKKSQLREVIREYVRDPKNEEQLESLFNNSNKKNINEGWQAVLLGLETIASLAFLPVSIGMGVAASGAGMDYDAEDDAAAVGLGSS